MENTAVAYIRVSTDEQAAHGVSLEMQDTRLRAYAVAMGLELVAVIREEGISATVPLAKRPGGKELLAMLAKKKARHVIALKLDRLFRNAANALTTTAEWDKAGIGLHMVDHGGQSINTASATGRMFFTMLAGFAQFERDLISERTTAALRHKKSRLQAYAPTPIGFDRDGKNLIRNEGEAATVALIQRRRDDGMTLKAIADELNGAKVPGKRGGRWYPSTVRYVLGNDLHAA